MLRRWATIGAIGVLSACGDPADRPPLMDGSLRTAAGDSFVADAHREGGVCEVEGATEECGKVLQRIDDDVVCLRGTRSCEQGHWTACEGTKRIQIYAPPVNREGRFVMALASSGASCEDLCAPECQTFQDTPEAVEPGSGLTATVDGITLTTGQISNGNCTDLTISPASATITITGIDPSNGSVVASPSTIAFSGACNAGLTIAQPSWTLGAYDRAVIDVHGNLSVFSAIAGPIVVTGSNGLTNPSPTATVNVVVNIQDPGTDATIATQFDAVGSGVDSGKTLYPYKNTVFPLDLKPPLVQWETGGNNATEVQVALRYPQGTTSPSFIYSKIYNTGDPREGTLNTGDPAWRIPEKLWLAFARASAGGTGEIVIQRRYGGVVRPEMLIPVKFATMALRGTLYYTQYLRSFTNLGGASSSWGGQTPISATSYVPGNVCPVGNCTHPNVSGTSTTRAIDLASPTAPNADPFNGTAGCPVCHSISANGRTHVSASQYWQAWPSAGTSKGINQIGKSASGTPLFSPLDDAPNYSTVSSIPGYQEDPEFSWGFSYAAIDPEGSRVLQGPTFWGNTQDTPSSNNVQNAVLTGIAGKPKPYFFASTSNPGAGVQFATAGSIPSNTQSGNVLNATANGTLTIDGRPMATNYSVLVKDEAGSNASKNGIYTVTSAGSTWGRWKLTRRSDADATGEITTGMEVRVSDGNANIGKVFYVTTTGTITPNSTQIQFAERSMPTLPSMMVPVFAPNGRRVAYVSADNDSISGQPDAGWRRGLTMFDFDPTTLAIFNKKRLVNNWNSTTPGMPVKWPFFEHDSRSLLYIESDPNDYCNSNAKAGKCTVAGSDTPESTACTASSTVRVDTNLERACYEAGWGSMSPTTRGFWPGTVVSIDTEAANPAATRAPLLKLTHTEDPSDTNMAYQPTVLPFSMGGYRWVIFTSQRPYGHQINPKGTHWSCSAAMLWLSALTDSPADGTDRSNPAFLVPGQNMADITATNHYVNERGYLVPSACKDIGTACSTNDECCGANGTPATAACRAPAGWTPAAGPPAKTCAALSGTCGVGGAACESATDCCNEAPCENFQCTVLPPLTQKAFEREYHVECPTSGHRVVWGAFLWHAEVPDSVAPVPAANIRFSAQSSIDGDYANSPLVHFASATTENSNPPPSLQHAEDVGEALTGAGAYNGSYLRITIDFVPSGDGRQAPTLIDWEQRYACVSAE